MPEIFYPIASTIPSSTRYGRTGINLSGGGRPLPVLVGGATALNTTDESSYIDWDGSGFTGVGAFPNAYIVEVAFGSLSLNLFTTMKRLEFHVIGHGGPGYPGVDHPGEFEETKISVRLTDGNGQHLYKSYHFTDGTFTRDWPPLDNRSLDNIEPWITEVEYYGHNSYKDNWGVLYDVNRTENNNEFVVDLDGTQRYGAQVLNPAFDPTSGVFAYLTYAESYPSGETRWEFSGRINNVYLRFGDEINTTPVPVFLGFETFYKTIFLIDAQGNEINNTSSRSVLEYEEPFWLSPDGAITSISADGFQLYSSDLKSGRFLPLSSTLHTPGYDGNFHDVEVGLLDQNILFRVPDYVAGAVWILTRSFATGQNQLYLSQIYPASATMGRQYNVTALPTFIEFNDDGDGGVLGGVLYTKDFVLSPITNEAWELVYPAATDGTPEIGFGYTHLPATGFYVGRTPLCVCPRTDGLWATHFARRYEPTVVPGYGVIGWVECVVLVRWQVAIPEPGASLSTINVQSPVFFPLANPPGYVGALERQGPMLTMGPDGLFYFMSTHENRASNAFLEAIYRVDPNTLVPDQLNPISFFCEVPPAASGDLNWIMFPLVTHMDLTGTVGAVTPYFSRGRQ